MTALRDTIDAGLGACRRTITSACANTGFDQLPFESVAVKQVRTAKTDSKSGANGVGAPVRYCRADDHVSLDSRDHETVGMERGQRRPHRAKANFVSAVANPYGQTLGRAASLREQMEMRHRAGGAAIAPDAVEVAILVGAVENRQRQSPMAGISRATLRRLWVHAWDEAGLSPH